MKIHVYKVPYTLKRVGGEVELNLDEEKKQFVREEPVSSQDYNRVPNIAKELADSNDTQRTLVKGSLLQKEKQSEGFIEMRYLVN